MLGACRVIERGIKKLEKLNKERKRETRELAKREEEAKQEKIIDPTHKAPREKKSPQMSKWLN